MLWREKLENVRAARRELMAWYERLEEARREGRPFDEPPPFADANGRA